MTVCRPYPCSEPGGSVPPEAWLHRGRRQGPALPSPGFTLIEVLAAILLTTIVITIAVGFYINLSNASTRAVQTMQGQLHATAVLERVARDLSGASLLAREDESADPLSHPWYFASASRYAFGGSDALKFISRSQQPKVSGYHVSDLAQVAYFTEIEDDGTLTLYRWTAPSLPLRYDTTFPAADAPRSQVLAEGLESLTFRFRSEEGEWLDEWDSTLLVQSGRLPTAVEVSVSVASEATGDVLEEDVEPLVYTRMIVLHQRPLDLQKMIADRIATRNGLLAAAGENPDDEGELDEDGNPIDPDENAGGMTVAQCVNQNMAACQAQFGAGNCQVWANISSIKISGFNVALPPEWGCR